MSDLLQGVDPVVYLFEHCSFLETLMMLQNILLLKTIIPAQYFGIYALEVGPSKEVGTS